MNGPFGSDRKVLTGLGTGAVAANCDGAGVAAHRLSDNTAVALGDAVAVSLADRTQEQPTTFLLNLGERA